MHWSDASMLACNSSYRNLCNNPSVQPRLTFADWSVVAPGSKDLSHSLAANGLTALKNIVFSATELHHAADAAHKHTVKRICSLVKASQMWTYIWKCQFWLGAVWPLPEVVAMAFSILWLSGVGAGVRRLSHSTFIYYTQTRPPQNPESIKPFPPDFSVLMHLAFPFCAISSFLSVSPGSFLKNYYLITDTVSTTLITDCFFLWKRQSYFSPRLYYLHLIKYFFL